MEKLKISHFMFGFALLASGYWVASLFINYNQSGIVSVITELLWLPMPDLLFIIRCFAGNVYKRKV